MNESNSVLKHNNKNQENKHTMKAKSTAVHTTETIKTEEAPKVTLASIVRKQLNHLSGDKTLSVVNATKRAEETVKELGLDVQVNYRSVFRALMTNGIATGKGHFGRKPKTEEKAPAAKVEAPAKPKRIRTPAAKKTVTAPAEAELVPA